MNPLLIRDEVAINKFSKASERKTFAKVYDAITNRGIMMDDEGTVTRYSLKDLVTHQDLTRYIPQTFETIVREEIEPNLFIYNELFQKMGIEPGRTVKISSIGAIEVGRVGQGGEFPESFININDGGDMVSLSPDKYGIKISVTQDVIDANLIDVIGLWLRAAGKAFARNKERLSAKLISEMGYDVFNNINPSTSFIGTTTGRGIDGVANGSMTVHDTYEMYAFLAMRGFSPDTLMMHPMHWKAFMCDVEMKEIVFNGSTLASYKGPNGNGVNGWQTGQGNMGYYYGKNGRESTSGNTVKGASAFVQTLNPLGATYNIAPRNLPGMLKVIVSNYVPFRLGSRISGATMPANEYTEGAIGNIIMVDSSACGVAAVQHEVLQKEWDTPERDIRNIRLSESFGLGVLEQGKGIVVARNITTDRHYNFENTNNVELSDIYRDSGVISGTSL